VANFAISFGVILMILGVGGYFATGMQSWTALIPALFGVVLLILGFVAREPSRRKHAMHAAAALGVLGFAGAFPGVIKAVKWMGGAEPARPAAVVSQVIMAVLMLVFVAMCVRSFIAARRTGSAGGGFDVVTKP
jgi:hypothetical protein